MMLRLQEQFELDPNQNIIMEEGTPNDLTCHDHPFMVPSEWKHWVSKRGGR